MKVLITGATGLIGKELSLELLRSSHEVRILTRNKANLHLRFSLPIKAYEWDFQSPPPKGALEGVDAVVHLAGENVAGRWTSQRKKQIYDSRIISTKNLVSAINQMEKPPRVFLSSSAIGYYGHQGDREVDETTVIESKSSDFLMNVCHDWEKATEKLSSQVRKVILRTGLVLSRNNGFLGNLEDLFRSGFAGPLGNGGQWMSWIHIKDLTRQIVHFLNNESTNGIFNGVSPTPVTNKDFTQTLSALLSRPAFLPAPYFAVRTAAGEFADAIFASQKVKPKRTLDSGFDFLFTDLENALKDIFSHKPDHRFFESFQWLPLKPEELFPFFSDERNLEKITPSSLGFHVVKKSTPEVQEGTLIDYRLKIHGIPTRWRTEILDWEENKRFVDTQLKGPYTTWHHTHLFEALAGGTLMTDQVLFQLPMGWLGDTLASYFVKKDIHKIFKHRTEVVHELFGAKSSEDL